MDHWTCVTVCYLVNDGSYVKWSRPGDTGEWVWTAERQSCRREKINEKCQNIVNMSALLSSCRPCPVNQAILSPAGSGVRPCQPITGRDPGSGPIRGGRWQCLIMNNNSSPTHQPQPRNSEQGTNTIINNMFVFSPLFNNHIKFIFYVDFVFTKCLLFLFDPLIWNVLHDS